MPFLHPFNNTESCECFFFVLYSECPLYAPLEESEKHGACHDLFDSEAAARRLGLAPLLPNAERSRVCRLNSNGDDQLFQQMMHGVGVPQAAAVGVGSVSTVYASQEFAPMYSAFMTVLSRIACGGIVGGIFSSGFIPLRWYLIYIYIYIHTYIILYIIYMYICSLCCSEGSLLPYLAPRPEDIQYATWLLHVLQLKCTLL